MHQTPKSQALTSKTAKNKSFIGPDGKPYTLEDIEHALRWANSGYYNERYTDKMKAEIKKGVDAKSVMYDDYGWGKPIVQGNSVVYNQQLNTNKIPNTQLIAFIQAHPSAKKYKYTWDKNAQKYYAPNHLTKTTNSTTPTKKAKAQSQISDRQLRSKDSAIINGGGGVDLSGSGNIQAKSDKMTKERVMPIVQTGVGMAEISAGVAVCTTGLGCTAGEYAKEAEDRRNKAENLPDGDPKV